MSTLFPQVRALGPDWDERGAWDEKSVALRGSVLSRWVCLGVSRGLGPQGPQLVSLRPAGAPVCTSCKDHQMLRARLSRSRLATAQLDALIRSQGSELITRIPAEPSITRHWVI